MKGSDEATTSSEGSTAEMIKAWGLGDEEAAQYKRERRLSKKLRSEHGSGSTADIIAEWEGSSEAEEYKRLKKDNKDEKL